MPLEYIDNQLHLVQSGKAHNLNILTSKSNGPFYLYDIDGVIKRYHSFKDIVGFTDIFFALKSNHCKPLVQSLIKQGSGLDVVSGGELKYGLKLGVHPNKIVFSGVGKTKEEHKLAIRSKIFQINVESLEELVRIGEISRTLKQNIRVSFRLNPNILMDTHKHIQTGMSENKFGMEEKDIREFIDIINRYQPYLKFQGLAIHIGSGGLDFQPIVKAISKMRDLYERLNKEGLNLKTIDIGGGLGIDYKTQDLSKDMELLESFSKNVKTALEGFNGKVLVEPGRFIVARFGWLISEVQYVKETYSKKFVILDTGMHHLIRPVLYEAYHELKVLQEKADSREETYTIGGPVCESADILAKDRKLPSLKQGDHLIFCDVGAYGSVMSSQYNMFNKAKEFYLLRGFIKKTTWF